MYVFYGPLAEMVMHTVEARIIPVRFWEGSHDESTEQEIKNSYAAQAADPEWQAERKLERAAYIERRNKRNKRLEEEGLTKTEDRVV